MQEFFLGCDWGTSSFRLRLFDVAADRVVAEVVTSEGIARMHSTWIAGNNENETRNKVKFFQQYLKEQIKTLSAKSSTDLDHLPVIISGMASSTIGMENVPYAEVPFAVNADDIGTRKIDADADFLHSIILISGVRTDNDVMRGEETQLLGLLHLMAQERIEPLEGILILPGTHSKHVQVKDGQLISFRTFMTGELFNVIKTHTILKDSIENREANDFLAADKAAFIAGIKAAQSFGILNGLFTVRTNQLFQKLDKPQNLFYLSGLLIGEELNYLLKENSKELVLCSGSNLFEFYKIGLDELNLTKPPIIVPIQQMDRSAIVGQKLVFEKHILKL